MATEQDKVDHREKALELLGGGELSLQEALVHAQLETAAAIREQTRAIRDRMLADCRHHCGLNCSQCVPEGEV